MKMTVKSLSEELEKIKEQVKEINVLKQKVIKLEETIENLQQNKNPNEVNKRRVADLKQVIKCNQCEESFDSKKNLKIHLVENHPQKVQCKTCDKVFPKNCLLEVHIKTHHLTTQRHECDLCDKTFVLRWRLIKHKQIHISQETKKCHYFKNGKTCPFDEIGCMFAHKQAEICKFDQICTNNLCSCQHSKTSRKQPITKDNNAVVETEDKLDSDSDKEEYSCISCKKMFDDVDDMIEHYGETGHNIEN